MKTELFEALEIGDIIRFNLGDKIYIRRVKSIDERENGLVSVFDLEDGEWEIGKDDIADSILNVGETIIRNNHRETVIEVDADGYRVETGWYPYTNYDGRLTFFVLNEEQLISERTPTNNPEIDNIVGSVESVLIDANYKYNHEPVQDMVSLWLKNKSALINLLRKHPGWSEENKCVIGEVEEIRDKEDDKFLAACKKFYGNCRKNGMYLSDAELDIMWDGVQRTPPDQFVTEEIQARYKAVGVETKIGEKYSRVLNRIFTSMGLDKYDNYNHDFAEIADAINPVSNKQRAILSVHPCDYLKMSWGENWNSCHDIRSKGCYHAGTQSYMLDSTSMIFYTVSNRGDDIPWKNNKLTREVFCYENGSLLQSRLYPDYTKERRMDRYFEFVKSIFDICLGIEDSWKKVDNRSSYIVSAQGSTHYYDYDHDQYHTRVFINNAKAGQIHIGHKSMSLIDGHFHSRTDNINYGSDEYYSNNAAQDTYYICYECEGYFYTGNGTDYSGYDAENNRWYCKDHYRYCDKCGEVLYGDEPEGRWVGEEFYCDDCYDKYVRVCDRCGEPFDTDNEDWYEDRNGNCYCHSCYEDAWECQNCGDLMFRSSEVHAYGDDHYCEDCFDELFFVCDECGEIHEIETAETDGYNSYCPDCYARIRVEETPSDNNNYRITNQGLVLMSPAGALRHGYNMSDFVYDNVAGMTGTRAITYNSGNTEVYVLRLNDNSGKYVAVLSGGVEAV